MTGYQLFSAFEWSDTLVAVYLTWHAHAQCVVLLGTLFGQGMKLGAFMWSPVLCVCRTACTITQGCCISRMA